MQHNEATTASPRRTLLWDETNARYIWLDNRARAAAARTRAKRIEFQSADSSPFVCALAEIYSHHDYDAQTRNVARSCRNAARKTATANADRARAAAKPLAAKPSRVRRSPIYLDEIAADLIAALAVL